MKSPSQNWLNITSLRNFIHLRLVLSNGRASQIVGRGKGEMWHVGGWWENKLFWWRRRTDQWPGWWSPPWTSISRSLMQVSIHVPLVHTSIQITCIHIKMSKKWLGRNDKALAMSVIMNPWWWWWRRNITLCKVATLDLAIKVYEPKRGMRKHLLAHETWTQISIGWIV